VPKREHTVNIITILLPTALMLLTAGTCIIGLSRDLVRLIIGLETLFLSGLVSLSVLYLIEPIQASELVFAYLAASVMETTLLIGVVYYLSRSGYRALVEESR